MANQKYKVKFINNKCNWYWSDEDCRIGDLVYCTGSQEGVLGKIIEKKEYYFGSQQIISVIGHIQLEDTDDIEDLWEDLSQEKRNSVIMALGQNTPFNKTKFINCISNYWTVKGSEGMEWNAFLPYIVEYTAKWELEASKGKTVSFDGFRWKMIEAMPETEKIENDHLVSGVLYATYPIIKEIKERYELQKVCETQNGIYRALFSDVSIMEKYPSCKIAFFSISGWYMDEARAVYSESGYPYLTKSVYKPLRLNHGEGTYIDYHYPDEVFREASSPRNQENPDISFNAPFDAEFRSLDYVVKRGDALYKMIGIDLQSPPKTSDEEWSYQTEGYNAVIVRYKGNQKNIIFPEKLGGMNVVGIAPRFGKEDDSYKNIRNITIPEGYQYIGAYAFCGCRRLEKATLPSSIKRIGDGAFLKCTKLKEITLPKRLRCITDNFGNSWGGAWMFKGCKQLEKAYIPVGLRYKEVFTFEGETKVCCRALMAKGETVFTCLIDTNERDTEISTFEVFAGQKLIIQHNQQKQCIELYTNYRAYAGVIVEKHGYVYEPVWMPQQYPDQTKIQIISEMTDEYSDNTIKAEYIVI